MSEISIDAFAVISVYTFVTELHHLCMIWEIIYLPDLIAFIVFSASPKDDNEFPIKLQCKLGLWLVAILSFWSTSKLLLGRRGRDRMVVGYITNLCNQSLSPLTLWVRICTLYNSMWWSLSVTCDRSVVFFGYSGFLHH